MVADQARMTYLITEDLEFRDLLDEEYPHQLQSVVLPIIVRKKGVVQLSGTAFSIGNNLALTARHVLPHEDTGIEEVALLHVARGAIPGQVHATLLQVEEVTVHPEMTDVAVLRIRPPDFGAHSPLPLPPMRLGMAPPNIGHPAMTLGYRYDGPLESVEDVLQLRPRLMASHGHVRSIHTGRYILCKSPTFQFNGESEGQMSGGPVLAPAGDGTNLLVVRGVLSTGMDLAQGEEPSSTASMVFTALALKPTVGAAGNQAPTFIYDLAASGRLPVLDLDVVEWTAVGQTRAQIGLRKRNPHADRPLSN